MPAPPRAATATTHHRVSAWDRAAVVTLGTAGCALSYDALQQMAVAIHTRGPLTYLFPFVIDGFIAYGVRALLVLHTAPFRARVYVWTLFGTATAASLWANALHAIRLNQQGTSTGLRFGDATVGLLSTVAPLALAGAVHLYILIARQPTGDADPTRRTEAPPADEPPNGTSGQAAPEVDNERHSNALRRIGRPPSAELDVLIDLARPLLTRHAKPTRDMVRQAIRAAGHRISEDRLTQIMTALRQQRIGATESPNNH